jgi:hypothetical protein
MDHEDFPVSVRATATASRLQRRELQKDWLQYLETGISVQLLPLGAVDVFMGQQWDTRNRPGRDAERLVEEAAERRQALRNVHAMEFKLVSKWRQPLLPKWTSSIKPRLTR